MEKEWIETITEVNTVNWRGEPIHLAGVRALKNPRTGRVRVFPYDIAKAEVRTIAEGLGILPRDVGPLLVIVARPGNFKAGDVLYKYHLQKILFYLWKELDRDGYAESLPRDEFIAARNGPVPKNLMDDLKRFETNGWVKIRPERRNSHESKRIILTKDGLRLAEKLWTSLPTPYKKAALKAKERIYPLDPKSVRNLVHKQYPEYQSTYIENDMD